MNIICYHSNDAKGNKSWLAHMDLGNCHMDFFGSTMLEAMEKAKAFFDGEKQRQTTIVGNIVDEAKADMPTQSQPISGKGQVFVGKVWMLNRATGQRARVSAAEVKLMTEAGYVIAGPRSK